MNVHLTNVRTTSTAGSGTLDQILNAGSDNEKQSLDNVEKDFSNLDIKESENYKNIDSICENHTKMKSGSLDDFSFSSSSSSSSEIIFRYIF